MVQSVLFPGLPKSEERPATTEDFSLNISQSLLSKLVDSPHLPITQDSLPLILLVIGEHSSTGDSSQDSPTVDTTQHSTTCDSPPPWSSHNHIKLSDQLKTNVISRLNKSISDLLSDKEGSLTKTIMTILKS